MASSNSPAVNETSILGQLTGTLPVGMRASASQAAVSTTGRVVVAAASLAASSRFVGTASTSGAAGIVLSVATTCDKAGRMSQDEGHSVGERMPPAAVLMHSQLICCDSGLLLPSTPVLH